jgi:hypothetical protein
MEESEGLSGKSQAALHDSRGRFMRRGHFGSVPGSYNYLMFQLARSDFFDAIFLPFLSFFAMGFSRLR